MAQFEFDGTQTLFQAFVALGTLHAAMVFKPSLAHGAPGVQQVDPREVRTWHQFG
jgi:hypothetical protein